MTGKELIIYILENDLENEPVFLNGKVLGLLSIDEVAAKMNVGTATIHAWINQDWIDCVLIGDSIYIPANFERPKFTINEGSR